MTLLNSLFFIINESIDFEIQGETSYINVGCAETEQLVIYHHDFCMQESIFIYIDICAHVHKCTGIGICGPIHEWVVGMVGYHQMYFDPAENSDSYRFEHRLVRDEIRRLDIDGFFGIVYHLQISILDLLPFFIRSAGSNLHRYMSLGFDCREVAFISYHVAACTV